MSTYAVEIDFPHFHTIGDRWLGIANVGSILIDGEIPTHPLQRVRMHLVNHDFGKIIRFDSDPTANPHYPIVIEDADNWILTVPEVDDDFLTDPGEWHWDMEFHDEGHAKPLTLYSGVIIATLDITK